MIEYARPPVIIGDFCDDHGSVIAYGTRWAHLDWDGPDETYSVTRHPERFQPFTDVARAIVEHLVTTYDVRREDSAYPSGITRTRLIPVNPIAAPMTFVFDPSPRVTVTAGQSASVAWFCPCDHCDEDVMVAIETLEREVSAVVDGGLREWLNDPGQGYSGDGLFLASSLRSIDGEIDQSSSSAVDDPARRRELRAQYVNVPPTWSAWRLRRR